MARLAQMSLAALPECRDTTVVQALRMKAFLPLAIVVQSLFALGIVIWELLDTTGRRLSFQAGRDVHAVAVEVVAFEHPHVAVEPAHHRGIENTLRGIDAAALIGEKVKAEVAV